MRYGRGMEETMQLLTVQDVGNYTIGVDMTKDNWIKEFEEYQSIFDEPGAFEKVTYFISQVEKDAIEKTNKRWRERCEKLKKVSPNYRDGNYLTDNEEVYNIALSDLLEDKEIE